MLFLFGGVEIEEDPWYSGVVFVGRPKDVCGDRSTLPVGDDEDVSGFLCFLSTPLRPTPLISRT